MYLSIVLGLMLHFWWRLQNGLPSLLLVSRYCCDIYLMKLEFLAGRPRNHWYVMIRIRNQKSSSLDRSWGDIPIRWRLIRSEYLHQRWIWKRDLGQVDLQPGASESHLMPHLPKQLTQKILLKFLFCIRPTHKHDSVHLLQFHRPE